MNIDFHEGLEEEIMQLLLSAFLGGLIGLEREWKGKEAGLRTIMIVTVAATLFTIVSYKMPVILEHPMSDITRIASYVVAGIGFLGAGLIFKAGNNVQGLTTATTVWAVTAIGIAVGSRLYVLSMITTALILFILILVDYFEKYMEVKKLVRTYQIRMLNNDSYHRILAHYFSDTALKLIAIQAYVKEGRNEYHFTLRGPEKIHQEAIDKILMDENIVDLKY